MGNSPATCLGALRDGIDYKKIKVGNTFCVRKKKQTPYNRLTSSEMREIFNKNLPN